MLTFTASASAGQNLGLDDVIIEEPDINFDILKDDPLDTVLIVGWKRAWPA
jgi:hypothetical protein